MSKQKVIMIYGITPDGRPRGKLIRPITFRGKDKDVPVDHIATNLKTLGISNAQSEQALKEI
jgi:hypothetical protein